MCIGPSLQAQRITATPGGPVLKFAALNMAARNGNAQAQTQLDQMRATMRAGMAARRAGVAATTTGGQPSVTGA